ncbi:MAG: DUF2322 family protein [Rhodocyclaceae bacterium]|nr:DUF2322 family protein [Rhodocyclaceae bacterium]
MTLAENLKQLPKVSHLAALQLIDADGNVVATIENKSGQTGSLAVYNHLAQLYGAITAAAAARGLELYAEHTADAKANPGKHPNIDRLVTLASGRAAPTEAAPPVGAASEASVGVTLVTQNSPLRVKQVFAGSDVT